MNMVTKMKTDWDRRARHHARYWIAIEDYQDDQTFSRSGEQTANAILDILSPRDPRHWKALEVGCGIGRVLKPLARYFAHLVGVDISKEMIAQSKEWLSGLKNVETIESSGVDLQLFPDESFELVYSYITFQHLPLPVFERYLAESHRVLRPGGCLVFQLYVGQGNEPPPGDTIALRAHEKAKLDERLEKAGFRREKHEVEHRTPEGLESWLILAKRSSSSNMRIELGPLETECVETDSPMDAHLYRNLASNYLREGKHSDAAATLLESMQCHPNHLDTLLELATLLVEEGRHGESVDILMQVTELHPKYVDAYLSLIQLLVLLGRQVDAREVVRRLEAGCADLDSELRDQAQTLIAGAEATIRE